MLTLTYRDLSTKVLGNLADRTIELINQSAVDTAINNPLTAELKTRSEEYNAVVIKKTYSGMGMTIEEADLQRDNCDASLKRILAGLAGFKGTPQAEAAQRLLNIYEETGSVSNKNYAEESVILDRRLAKLQESANSALITQLNLTSQFETLLAAQTEFNSLFLTQAETNSTLRQQRSATSIRQHLEDALRNLYGWINAQRNISPYNKLYTDVAEIIKAAKQSSRTQTKETLPPTKL